MDVYRKINREWLQFDFLSLNMDENQYFEQEIKSLGGRIYKISSPRETGIIRHIKQLIKIFKNLNIDNNLIVHAHTLHHCGIVLYAAKKAGAKIRIAHARNTNSKHTGIIAKINIVIGKWLITQYATHRLSISEDAAIFLFGRKWQQSKNSYILPNAVDLDKYWVNNSLKVENLRKKLSIPDDIFILGHVGRFEIMKNHHFVVELFAHYHKTVNPKSVLVLVGDGSLHTEIKEKVKDLELDSVVLLTGVRNDVHLFMKLFDVLLFPSLFEGLGGVVLEGQAAGTPCVISNKVPLAANLGLGLVKTVDLKAPMEEWITAIEKACSLETPSVLQIRTCFDAHNLSLSKEIEMLYKIYNVQ
jgi:glycosyltransferase EpsF